MADTAPPSERDARARQQFLGLTQADALNVRALREVFAVHAQEFAERFYQHLLADPHTAGMLADPAQLERLKHIQSEYFTELLEGVFDQHYLDKRNRVGFTHQRVGLEPFYYLGAYNQYIQLTFPTFCKAFGHNLERVLPHLLSLVKVIFLDISLSLDTYFQQATDQLRRRNEELQQALGLYMQAQRREEQLRKLLSHEVRGGLAAVITTLEDIVDVIKQTPAVNGDLVEQLESIDRRCWSLSTLLGEMLAPVSPTPPGARSHPGASEDPRLGQFGGFTWVDTGQIFENLMGRFGLYAEGRAIRLDLPDQAPRVWADPLQLREVFANLVSNAVRYLDKDEGRVEVSCRLLRGKDVPLPDGGHPDGEFYLFGVADNGPGIPSSIRARLFEPFVHGPGTPARPEGTGLGLYFVRTIIEQGGGRIWVDTHPNQGTRFWFTVPTRPRSEH